MNLHIENVSRNLRKKILLYTSNMTKLEQLLEEIKEHRNDMVARNNPYQQLTNLIYKWEEIISQEKRFPTAEERWPRNGIVSDMEEDK